MSRRSIPALVLSGALALSLSTGLAPSAAAPAAPRPASAGTALVAGQAPALQVSTAAADRVKKKKKKRAKKAPRRVRNGGSLSYSPRTYVGGQALTFVGRLATPGVRTIGVQQHMGRPGDAWATVPGVTARTTANGSFRFRLLAPDMFDIRFRVAAGGGATPSVPMSSKVQGSDIWVTGQQRDTGSRTPFTVRSGQDFGVSVDTTPDIPGRATIRGTPVYAGRLLTLQRRVSATQWETIATTRSSTSGTGSFTGLSETAGPVVYRVRQESVTTGGSRIGWIPSFPMHVAVRGGSTRPGGTTPPDAWGRGGAFATNPATGRGGYGASRTAQKAHGWTKKFFDFDWERGESIDDRPGTGTGSWTEYSDGAGRVSKHNGQLTLESKREDARGTGDFGTTSATMRGNDRAYGRWESRLRVRSAETGAPGGDYAVRLELVPASDPDDVCRRILVAEVHPHSKVVRFGAKNAGIRWTGSRTLGAPVGDSPAIAVEVLPRHVTWFWNGSPLGTVNHTKVVPGVPMTLRMSLVADGDEEMNQAVAFSDWQRGFPHTVARAVNGPALAGGSAPGCG